MLENQINSLSEQYDGLRIQLNRAKANAKIAQQAASRGQAALTIGQQAIAQLAAANYINSGLYSMFACAPHRGTRPSSSARPRPSPR